MKRSAGRLDRLVLFGVFQSMFRRPLVLRNLCDERFLDQTSLRNAAYGPFPLETCHAYERTKSSGKSCYRNLLNSAFSETSLAIESFISGNTCRVEQTVGMLVWFIVCVILDFSLLECKRRPLPLLGFAPSLPWALSYDLRAEAVAVFSGSFRRGKSREGSPWGWTE